MRCRFLIGVLLVSALLWSGRSGLAQDNPDRPKESSTPILDRLSEFGRKIFGPRQDDRERPKTAKSSTSRARPDEEPTPNRPTDRTYAPRAGSVSATATRRESELRNREPSATASPMAAPEYSAAGTGASARRFVRSDQEEEPASDRQADKAVPAVSGLVPIHERLANFRQSLFGKSGGGNAEDPAGAKTVPSVPGNPDQAAPEMGSPESSSARGERPRPSRVLVERPAGEARGAVPGVTRGPVADSPAIGLPNPESRTVAVPSGRTVRRDARDLDVIPSINPSLASPGNKPAEEPRAQAAQDTNSPGAGPLDSPARVSDPASPSEAVAGSKGPERSSEPKSGGPSGAAVFSAESPAVSVETSGPRQIVVGKEGVYEVVVRNRSAVAAEQLVVSVDVPQWTEVSGSDTTAGAVTVGRAMTQPGQIRWSLPRLDPQRAEKLTLRVVPRQSRPFELVARVDYSPPPSHATIEVQEAKLGIALHGPREVVFGKAEVYKLEISNSGTADAENVIVTLAPSTPGEKLAAAAHRFGTLPAGQKKTVAMELTARQDGNLSIAIEARADGGAHAQAAQEIVVRRARLTAEVTAPKVVFSGNEATYRIRVRNQGSAPANHVKVQAILPPGAKYVSGLQNASPVPNESKVLWTVERIGAGAEAAFSLCCALSGSGDSRLEVRCDAEGDAPITAWAVIRVETSANLALVVEEPSGPVELEGEATYQIRLQNRGTASANEVEVVVYFANNLEPLSAEGAHYKLGAGQVVFDAMPALAPGQSATFQVKAKAGVAGNHVFRVEVRAGATGIRLVREGTTRFYAAGAAVDPPALAQPAAKDASGSANELRAADRRNAAPQNDPPGAGGLQK